MKLRGYDCEHIYPIDVDRRDIHAHIVNDRHIVVAIQPYERAVHQYEAQRKTEKESEFHKRLDHLKTMDSLAKLALLLRCLNAVSYIVLT